MPRKKDGNLENILLEIAKNVTRIADNKIAKEVKEVYKEEVEHMYDEYEPMDYMRRYDDKGFGDDNNWDITVTPKNNSVDLELINETKAVNSYLRLDKIIEEGIYDWKGVGVKERPVYQRTDERLKSEQVVENILESELKKLGYKFK